MVPILFANNATPIHTPSWCPTGGIYGWVVYMHVSQVWSVWCMDSALPQAAGQWHCHGTVGALVMQSAVELTFAFRLAAGILVLPAGTFYADIIQFI